MRNWSFCEDRTFVVIVLSVRAPSRARSPRSASAHARLVAVEALGLEIVEIILKTPFDVQSEIVQERPGVDAGRVHVVETEPHRIIADRIDGKNCYVAL